MHEEIDRLMRFLIAPHQVTYLYSMAQQPLVGQGFLIIGALRSHSVDSSARSNSPTQRPPPDNTKHSKQTDIHAPGGIRTRNPSKRAVANRRLRTRGPWDRLPGNVNVKNKGEWDVQAMWNASGRREMHPASFRSTVHYPTHLRLSIGPFPLSFPTTWILVISEFFTTATMNIAVLCAVSLPGYAASCLRLEQSWSECTFWLHSFLKAFFFF